MDEVTAMTQELVRLAMEHQSLEGDEVQQLLSSVEGTFRDPFSAWQADAGHEDEASSSWQPVQSQLQRLRQLLTGIALLGEASPATQARAHAASVAAGSALASVILGAEAIDPTSVLIAPAPASSSFMGALWATVPSQGDGDRFRAAAGAAEVVVLGGGVCGLPSGQPALLGKGGADLTSTLLGAHTGASRVEIWTGGSGVFTADPARVPLARALLHLGHREAQELAAMGQHALQPASLVPAHLARTPVHVLPHSLQGPDEIDPRRVLVISADAAAAEEATILAVAQRKGQRLVSVSAYAMLGQAGFLARVFGPFAEAGISVDSIATSEYGVSFTIDALPKEHEGQLQGILTGLRAWATVNYFPNVAVVGIVGRRLRAMLPVLLGAVSSSLAAQPAKPGDRQPQAEADHVAIPVLLLSETSEDLNLALVVEEQFADSLESRLHQRLFEDGGGAVGGPGPVLQRPGELPLLDGGAADRTLVDAYCNGATAWTTLRQHFPAARLPVPGGGPEMERARGIVSASGGRRARPFGARYRAADAGPAAEAGAEARAEAGGADELAALALRLVDAGSLWLEERGIRELVYCEQPWWAAPAVRAWIEAAVGSDRGAYVYCPELVLARAAQLKRAIPCVSKFFYAMKANAHPSFIRAVAAAGWGIECVSPAEVELARRVLGDDAETPIHLTPNYAAPRELETAACLGATIVVDSPEMVEAWIRATGKERASALAGRLVGIRVDPGAEETGADGAGGVHCEKVLTAGPKQKFGCDPAAVPVVAAAIAAAGGRVVGVHAHVGSGVLNPGVWAPVAASLERCAAAVEAATGKPLEWVDVGGGLGVVEQAGQRPLPIEAVGQELAGFGRRLAERGIALQMEPGRYVSAPAGVLAARVTIVRNKGQRWFVGLTEGMNALVRPAMYGSTHTAVNVGATPGIDPPAGRELWASESQPVSVVGPVCESGDLLVKAGHPAVIPASTATDDLVLVANGGAYGRSMASGYNCRPPPQELLVPRAVLLAAARQ